MSDNELTTETFLLLLIENNCYKIGLTHFSIEHRLVFPAVLLMEFLL